MKHKKKTIKISFLLPASDVPAALSGFVHSGPCNNIFGCLEDEYFEQCMCSRDCGYDGEPVCGSDGLMYQNHCQMEVASCRNNTRIEQIPMSQCSACKLLIVSFFVVLAKVVHVIWTSTGFKTQSAKAKGGILSGSS